MGAAALPLMIGSSAASAISSIQAGKAQKAAYEAQKRAEQLKATQQSAVNTAQLNEALASQNAAQAAMGRTGESFASVIGKQLKDYNFDTRMNELGVAASGSQLSRAGKAAETAGYLSAASSIAGSAYKYSLIK